MSTWPASLPQQLIGTTEQDQDAVLRTGMDAGPPSRRNRYTARVTQVRVPMILTGTQKQAFDTFYRDTLKNGALSFDWEDPTTDETVSFAFRSPPTWRLIRGGLPAARVWDGELDLEIQP